jgi:hypothetical protein
MKIKHLDYYLENLIKKLNGRGNMNPSTNGEYHLIDKLLELNNGKFIFF